MNFERFLQQELNTTQGLRAILDTTPVEDIDRLVRVYLIWFVREYLYTQYIT